MIGKVKVTSTGYDPDGPRVVDPTLGPQPVRSDVYGRTYGDLYGPAMLIEDQGEAERYFDRLVVYHLSVAPDDTRERAEEVQRVNLGYYAGYYDHETRARVERLFNCAHPIFGAIAVKGPPTPEEAFQAGLQAGRATKVEEVTR